MYMSTLKKHSAKIFFLATCLAAAFVLGSFYAAMAATNINSGVTAHWAWNDITGWIDFYNTGTVNVTSQLVQGYASSSAGYISFDCTTSPNGNICGTSNYQVLNDGSGNLTGWAWNDTYGWVSFCGGQGTTNCPGAITYQVQVNGTTGDFGGNGFSWAWNDVLGWLSFNCADVGGGGGICATSNYKVNTTWIATSTTGYVVSPTFDTGVASGTQINSVLWKGSLPAGAAVHFQFAGSSTSTGPWSTFIGPDGTANTYYDVAANTTGQVDFILHNNYRFFRYKMTLVTNQAQTASPRVDDVEVNWSP